jgi:uncharacterized membrane protein HdeD (DUF308 family)
LRQTLKSNLEKKMKPLCIVVGVLMISAALLVSALPKATIWPLVISGVVIVAVGIFAIKSKSGSTNLSLR